MNSFTNERFGKAFRKLHPAIRKQAREAYQLFKQDPYHNSLHFKKVSPKKPIYSARVNLDYRVLGVRDGDTIVWFWIGSHAEYDKIISNL